MSRPARIVLAILNYVAVLAGLALTIWAASSYTPLDPNATLYLAIYTIALPVTAILAFVALYTSEIAGKRKADHTALDDHERHGGREYAS